ncbi:MAG: Flp pilus assembly complex ATPase component [Desulfobacterales bacterium]|nr:Flp pilus assembly complex ATPase component [Desulfobacterales bacterium]
MNRKQSANQKRAASAVPTTPPVTRQHGEIAALLIEKGLLETEQLAYAARIQSKLSSPKPILDVIKELKLVTDEQIRSIIRSNLSAIKIGDLLIELGLITSDELQVALALQKEETPRKKLGEVLVDHNFLEEQKLIEVLSLQMGYPYIEPEFVHIDRVLLSRGSLQSYKAHNFIPIRVEDDELLVAFADPLDPDDINEARNLFGSYINTAIATKRSIHRAIKKISPETDTLLHSYQNESAMGVVNEIILAAIQADNVSDIHIEPMADRLRVRFRRDGVLQLYKDYTREVIAGLTSRIKVMCEADITEKRRHQGGRIFFEFDGEEMDLRVSIFVTVHGEKIVLRLLNRKNELLQVKDIGMSPRMLDRFLGDALDCPSGVVIVTGPTGSGKTTTIYSCINHLNKPETSIITAEEPVEYVIDGIAQCSINPRINMTFEETLRHIVRQDPDVIVIGEIRDEYSAGVAVQAALTGHKVLTTFHTEDSIGGLVRLLNMDIDAFLISSTVVCVVAQRLMRKVCPDCVSIYQPTPKEYLVMGYAPKDLEGATFMVGRGCPQCDNTGYRGRIAVFEMLVLNEPVRDAILERKTSHQIRQICIDTTGLVTLFEDGISKAAEGVTTIEEAIRCLPRLLRPRPLAEINHLLGK